MSIANRLNGFNWPAAVATTTAPPPAPPLSWSSIVAIDRRVADLARRARRLKSTNWRLYASLKLDLQRLAGWHAANPVLRSSEVYDLCHRRIFGGRI